MGRRIVSRSLTTCEPTEDGAGIRLGFLDAAGKPVSVEFPFEQAASLIMTLPRLLSAALQARTGSEQSRFVFSLGQWRLESAENSPCLFATLTTTDGFEVTFGIPPEDCVALGSALQQEGKESPTGRYQ